MKTYEISCSTVSYTHLDVYKRQILACTQIAAGVELTFELLDNAKDCFYEDIQLNTSCTLEYQVRLKKILNCLPNPNTTVVYLYFCLGHQKSVFSKCFDI